MENETVYTKPDEEKYPPKLFKFVVLCKNMRVAVSGDIFCLGDKNEINLKRCIDCVTSDVKRVTKGLDY